jgi:hypothetical protein
MRFRAPSETIHRSPAPQRPGRPEGRSDSSRDAASPGFWCPTTQSRPGRSACMMATAPTVAACHVRGLGTPLAASTTGPPDARGVGASMGFALQGVPLVRKRCPSRGPCPPDVAGRSELPEGRGAGTAAFRALFPRRVRAVTGFPKEPDRRYLPGLLPSRAFSPSARALACSHEAGPLALGRDDVPTLLDLRASRIGWIGMVRFRIACSHGVLHLVTVAALRSTQRGAGSWFHLTQDIVPKHDFTAI